MMMIMAVVVLVMTIRMVMMTMMHSEAGWTIQQTQGFSIYRGLGPHVNSYSRRRHHFHHRRHNHQHHVYGVERDKNIRFREPDIMLF